MALCPLLRISRLLSPSPGSVSEPFSHVLSLHLGLSGVKAVRLCETGRVTSVRSAPLGFFVRFGGRFREPQGLPELRSPSEGLRLF